MDALLGHLGLQERTWSLDVNKKKKPSKGFTSQITRSKMYSKRVCTVVYQHHLIALTKYIFMQLEAGCRITINALVEEAVLPFIDKFAIYPEEGVRHMVCDDIEIYGPIDYIIAQDKGNLTYCLCSFFMLSLTYSSVYQISALVRS